VQDRQDPRGRLVPLAVPVLLDLLDPKGPLVLRDPRGILDPLVLEELLAVLALLAPQERKVLQDQMELLAQRATQDRPAQE